DLGAADPAILNTDQGGWTLDPIDGTKGFLRGEQYCVCLALIRRGRVETGVLGCPNLAPGQDGEFVPKHSSGFGSRYWAVRGDGVAHMIFQGTPCKMDYTVSNRSVFPGSPARLAESIEIAHA